MLRTHCVHLAFTDGMCSSSLSKSSEKLSLEACHRVQYANAGPYRIFTPAHLCVFRVARPSSVTNRSRGVAAPEAPNPRPLALLLGKPFAFMNERVSSMPPDPPPNAVPASRSASPCAASLAAMAKCVPIS